MNDTLKFILIALIIVCLYHNYGKEGFSYRYNTPVLEGYNNMVLTNPNGDLSSIPFPKGIIVIWNGRISDVPKGWALCDGSQGTPNLSGKFVLGVDDRNEKYRTIGSGGGVDKITLTEPQLPSHKHSGPSFDGNNSCTCGGGGCACSVQTNGTGSVGEGKPVDIMPPYLVLAYIMKL
jgi:microcystin-dependent protein